MNAGDACSGGPSGVGLSSCAGTVASRRARLGRTEVRQAKRAGAEEASMLPPNPVETWTYHLKGHKFTPLLRQKTLSIRAFRTRAIRAVSSGARCSATMFEVI